jgi:hypothetical protein
VARWLELLPLDELLRRPAPRNAKRHDEAGIRASITRHGFVENPTIDERTGRLVAGHGRVADIAARRDAGEDAPDGIDVAEDGSWMIPVQRGWASRSDADAEALVVASNRLVEAGGWDEDLLAEMLRDYQDEPNWLTGTGYDEKSIVSFLASVGTLPDNAAAPDQSDLLTHQQAVMVECANDDEQRLLIERLTKEGYTCRALNT